MDWRKDTAYPDGTTTKSNFRNDTSFLGQVDTKEEAESILSRLKESFPECFFSASLRYHWGELSHLPGWYNITVDSRQMNESLFQRIESFADNLLHKKAQ